MSYRNAIVSCNGVTTSMGDLLTFDNVGTGPTKQGVLDLIGTDPTATWDPTTTTVVNSAFTQSPRVIALLRGGLPAGQALYARLWTQVNGYWRFVDTTFFIP